MRPSETGDAGQVSAEAWSSYASVESQCSLEGPRERWWVCAIYLASRSAAAEEEGEGETTMNLGALVKASGLSVLGLLEQLGKWGEMGGAGPSGAGGRRTAEAIARVQAVFATSAVLFRKFLAAFRVVFAVDKVAGGSASKRVARGKRNEAASLLHFLWTLFIAAKTKLGTAEDVLTGFHLLLSVLDYARRDLVEQGQTHLLNADWVQPEEEDEDGSIIHQLCDRFHGSVLDAKHFHVHWWQGKVEGFVVDGLLPTAAESGILNAADAYRKALEGVYEAAMLRRGEMDERIFIPADVAVLLSPAAVDHPMIGLEQGQKAKESDTELLLRMSLQSCMEKVCLPASLTLLDNA